MKYFPLVAFILPFFFACQSNPEQAKEPPSLTTQPVSLVESNPETPEVLLDSEDESAEIDLEEEVYWEPEAESDPVSIEKFDRSAIKAHLEIKVAEGETLFVHLFVPLCDNDNQGIVPVPASIGNGQNPRTNLYWGAGYGVKNFFDKKQPNWKLITKTSLPENPDILERLLFYRKFDNGAKVCLVADAYDGAKMETCLDDYFKSLAGRKQNTWNVAFSEGAIPSPISLHGGADLLIFNGHNGLMDENAHLYENTDGRKKDAMVIACISYPYFEEYLATAGGYPLLMTTNLLAPEAYVIEAAIEKWALLKEGPEVHQAAGAAYHKYQKCGLRGGLNTFRTGWE